jgi:hypothetical protein
MKRIRVCVFEIEAVMCLHSHQGLKTNTGPTIQYEIILGIVFLSCQPEKVGIKPDIRMIVVLEMRVHYQGMRKSRTIFNTSISHS